MTPPFGENGGAAIAPVTLVTCLFYVYDLRVFTPYHRLSWGLLYAVLVTVMSILMSIIATCTALFPNSDFFIIFTLIFLYGISSVSTTEVLPRQQQNTVHLHFSRIADSFAQWEAQSSPPEI